MVHLYMRGASNHTLPSTESPGYYMVQEWRVRELLTTELNMDRPHDLTWDGQVMCRLRREEQSCCISEMSPFQFAASNQMWPLPAPLLMWFRDKGLRWQKQWNTTQNVDFVTLLHNLSALQRGSQLLPVEGRCLIPWNTDSSMRWERNA